MMTHQTSVHILPCHIGAEPQVLPRAGTEDVAGLGARAKEAARATFDQAIQYDEKTETKTRIFQGKRLKLVRPPRNASFFLLRRTEPTFSEETKIDNLSIWCTDDCEAGQVRDQWEVLSTLNKLMTDATHNG